MSRRSERKDQLEKVCRELGFDEAAYRKNGISFRQQELKMCLCGARPLIERSVYEEESWVIHCPRCYRRARSTGTYERVKRDWNREVFSPDSLLVAEPMTRADTEGSIALMAEILRPGYLREQKKKEAQKQKKLKKEEKEKKMEPEKLE